MEINFDDRKKIAFPRFHHYDYAIRYIAEQALGLCYIQLPPATSHSGAGKQVQPRLCLCAI